MCVEGVPAVESGMNAVAGRGRRRRWLGLGNSLLLSFDRAAVARRRVGRRPGADSTMCSHGQVKEFISCVK
uniref:Uncharacterized protein n=1 Tax=Oryza meridionalis TaxID=40149 RepID=A0A0E0E102_9ORYZ